MTGSAGASLAGILAHATASLLHWSREHEAYVAGGGRAGEYFDHGYQLCFERATDVLSRLGVIEHYRGPVYRLCVGLEEIETGVAVASCEDLPPMDEIISAFLGVADHRALFPVNADAVFQVRETCEPALLALAEAGYAQHADGYFAWEEKIRRAMALQYFWPGMRAPARS